MPGFSELFASLRPLRIRAGLTQAQVAAALGKKGRPEVTVVSRLEHGRFGNPSLRLVLYYLLSITARRWHDPALLRQLAPTA